MSDPSGTHHADSQEDDAWLAGIEDQPLERCSGDADESEDLRIINEGLDALMKHFAETKD